VRKAVDTWKNTDINVLPITFQLTFDV